jgi:argininosuccinate lyase
MKQKANRDYILATDLADYLVSKGETFRNAHGITSSLVSYSIRKGKTLSQLSLSEYKRFSPLFNSKVLSISAESSITGKNIAGGTAPQQVKKALERARKIVGKLN